MGPEPARKPARKCSVRAAEPRAQRAPEGCHGWVLVCTLQAGGHTPSALPGGRGGRGPAPRQGSRCSGLPLASGFPRLVRVAQLQKGVILDAPHLLFT